MKEKRISKVGTRWKKTIADSEKRLEEIIKENEIKPEKPKRIYNRKKKYVKPENDSDIGDIGINIDEHVNSSEILDESEV